MNIYTYQIRNIPPLTKELNQEISTLEQLISDLIVSCAGNFHALEKLESYINQLPRPGIKPDSS